MAELKGKQLLVATIINLLVLGVLSYNSLPEAYCGLEDKTVKYIHMSVSGKTVTKVVQVPGSDGEYRVADDRCQKGTTIEPWVKVNSNTVKDLKGGLVYIAVVDVGDGELVTWYCPDPLNRDTCIRKDEILSVFT